MTDINKLIKEGFIKTADNEHLKLPKYKKPYKVIKDFVYKDRPLYIGDLLFFSENNQDCIMYRSFI